MDSSTPPTSSILSVSPASSSNMNQRASGSSFKNMWSSLTGNRNDDDDSDADAEKEKQKELAKTITFQDKIINSLIEQVIDPSSPDSSLDGKTHHKYAGPLGNGLSLPIMTDNFRRFNGRIGVVFHFQHQVETLLQWRNPTHTFSLLATFTLVCLHPTLLVSLPLIVFLVFIMVPGYLARHPAPPVINTSSTTAYYSYDGPATAPAQALKPAPDMSRDFLNNMAHLQRSMGDFSDAYDAVVAALLPAANFSNERLSSTIFLMCTAGVCWLLVTAHLVPWNLVMLVVGDVAILAGSERVRWHAERVVQNLRGEHEKKGDEEDEKKSGLDEKGNPIEEKESPGSKFLDSLKSSIAITLSTSPEIREVEIFELQHKITSSYSSSPTWETFMFTPTPYDPLCPARIAGDRPRGCRFFEDVQPPEGWTWHGHKWELDLDAKEWVLERMVTGVGVEGVGGVFDTGVHHDKSAGKGEEMGGWVWDLPQVDRSQGAMYNEGDESDDGEDIPAYASEDWADTRPGSGAKLAKVSKETSKEKLKKLKEKTKGKLGKDLEERVWAVGNGEMGGWRRRRWVRLVRRVGAEELGGER